LPTQGLAGMVYSCGLRRCLIIFAPHAFVLDRWTCTCQAPSLLLILQRSKNFTSGAAISLTLSSPIVSERWLKPQAGQGMATSLLPGLGHTPLDATAQGTTTGFPLMSPKAGTTPIATSGQCCDVPWMGIRPRTGCFGHTEFSTVTTMVDSSGGRVA